MKKLSHPHHKAKPHHPPRYRVMNRNGTSNVDRSKLRRSADDAYHTILSMGWLRFLLITLGLYIFINLIFGGLYNYLGSGGLSGLETESELSRFWSSFFFSIQTFSTIGYGNISPHSFFANFLVSIEAFIGMLSIAVMSGLFFARFSRPKAKVRFSRNALITKHLGKNCLIFRMSNERMNQIAEADVSVVLLRIITTPEGNKMRMQEDLKLMRSHSQVFSASWLVAHEIDENSPFWNTTPEKLEESASEVLVSVMGYDEVFSQNINARFSYLHEEILWNRNFVDFVSVHDGYLHVDIDKISDLKPEVQTSP